RSERTKALINKALTGLENRLLPNHALAFDLFDFAVAVRDDPVAGEKLHAHVTFVFDAHFIRKIEQSIGRIAALALKSGFHFDVNVASRGCKHERRKCVSKPLVSSSEGR